MSAICGSPNLPEYHALYESKLNRQSNKRYYRYVIVSDMGQPLFDGYAGDMEEARAAAKAHIRRLEQISSSLPSVGLVISPEDASVAKSLN